ncbi:hypothetical protein C0J52_18789 [Blattella germanica]|nr:hypothetical protein C0J52_18789 [Blattella germanica]
MSTNQLLEPLVMLKAMILTQLLHKIRKELSILLLPKAIPREKSNRGRRVGKTMIATDTPEKLALREQK